MIRVITQENAYLYGDAIASMYRLRYRAFIERQSYNVSSIRKMEYDAYDTPAAVYLVWQDINSIVRGCTRLSPTTRPYMIKDLWPSLLGENPAPVLPGIWEASRFCIEKELPIGLRKEIHGELIYALQEFGLRMGMDAMIGVMQPQIWRQVFIKMGWPIEYLGPAMRIGVREQIYAGLMPMAPAILKTLQTKLGLPESILGNLDEDSLKEAA